MFRYRVRSLITYRAAFYAPHITGKRAAARLRALGFYWDGQRWRAGPIEWFLAGVQRKAV